MKTNFLVIIAIAVGASWLGGQITAGGLDWYQTLTLPDFRPSGSVFGTVWTVIYILTTISALIVYNRLFNIKYYHLTIFLFAINALLNVGWSFIFFGQQLIGPAVAVSAGLGLSVLALIIMIWRHSLTAAVLLLPYLFWVAFATYLNYTVWRLN